MRIMLIRECAQMSVRWFLCKRQLLTYSDSDRRLERLSDSRGLTGRRRDMAPNACGAPAEDRYRKAAFA